MLNKMSELFIPMFEKCNIELLREGDEDYDNFPPFEDLNEHELLDILHDPNIKPYIEKVNSCNESNLFLDPKFKHITFVIGGYGDVSSFHCLNRCELTDFDVTRAWLQIKAYCRYHFSDIPPKGICRITLKRT